MASLWLRYLWHTGEERIFQKFLSDTRVPLTPHPIWVSNLSALRQVMPRSWRFDSLETIEKHCVLPFCSPFLPHAALSAHLDWAERRRGKVPPYDGSVAAFKFSGAYRACAKCVAQDIEKYGEPYLHRAHHLPGISLCLEHRLPLSSITNWNKGFFATESRPLAKSQTTSSAPWFRIKSFANESEGGGPGESLALAQQIILEGLLRITSWRHHSHQILRL